MKQFFGALALGTVVVCGCGEQTPQQGSSQGHLAAAEEPTGEKPIEASTNGTPSPSSASDMERVIAHINGRPVTLRQLVKPLIESRGLVMLVNIMQLELAKQNAANNHVTVTREDVKREEDLTLERQFKDADPKLQEQLDDAISKNRTDDANRLRQELRQEREQLLAQALDNQQVSRSEYEMLMEINSYCRKEAERILTGKISDDLVEKEFGIEYGETAQVRYIQLTNMQEVGEARRRLKSGEPFEYVAREMSHGRRSGELGGELPRFSRQTPGLPESFKEMAFSLSPGQVSDPVNDGNSYYLIKLEKKFSPKAVKFESVKESLRQAMFQRAVQGAMDEVRVALAKQTEKLMKIDDPLLRRQYEQKIAQRDQTVRDRTKIEEELKKQRERLHLPSTTAPTTAPTTQP